MHSASYMCVWLEWDMACNVSHFVCLSISFVSLNITLSSCVGLLLFAVICCAALFTVLALLVQIYWRLGKTMPASMMTLQPSCSCVQWTQKMRIFPSRSSQWYVHPCTWFVLVNNLHDWSATPEALCDVNYRFARNTEEMFMQGVKQWQWKTWLDYPCVVKEDTRSYAYYAFFNMHAIYTGRESEGADLPPQPDRAQLYLNRKKLVAQVVSSLAGHCYFVLGRSCMVQPRS